MDTVRDAGMDERLTVAEAAQRLGITKEAVRKRISRRTLRSDKDPDGTVYAYVPASETPSGTASLGYAHFDRDELIAELRNRIEDLRADRDAWRDQARRSDYMANSAMERTRELENRLRELEPASYTASSHTAQEAPESPENPGPTATPTEEPGGPREATGSPQSEAPRQWWQRLFGGGG